MFDRWSNASVPSQAMKGNIVFWGAGLLISTVSIFVVIFFLVSGDPVNPRKAGMISSGMRKFQVERILGVPDWVSEKGAVWNYQNSKFSWRSFVVEFDSRDVVVGSYYDD